MIHRPAERKTEMAKTFTQMVAEAAAEVSGISPLEAQRRLAEDPRALLIDVRDAESIRATGKIPGAATISAGSLLFKADQEVPAEWRDARVQDHSRPIITQCDLGPLGAISAKNLRDMGFTNVSYLDGGIAAWKQAGLPTEEYSR
jgi:rhodanese-related sulfurtransferase